MIPVAWCGSIDRLSGRRRSKFLFRRVEARLTCGSLFGLDALHVLEDAEELRSALRENYMQDREKLRLRLSARQEKKRRKGKNLPDGQWVLLSAFLFISPSLSVEKNTGFDLIRAMNDFFSKMIDRV